jgi:hypothetical protein
MILLLTPQKVSKARQTSDVNCNEALMLHSDKIYQDCWSPARHKMEQIQKQKQNYVLY